MEVPKNDGTRIGDLPRELRNEVRAYTVIPEIFISGIVMDKMDVDTIDRYKLTIIFADITKLEYNLHVYNLNEEKISVTLSELNMDKYDTTIIGEIYPSGGSDPIEVYINSDGTLFQAEDGCNLLTLSKEALSILVTKLKSFFSDYLQYIKSPESFKMKSKY